MTDIQINVPPAAAVAFLAGRADERPTCPDTVLLRNKHGQLAATVLVDSSLRQWVHDAQNQNVETARAQRPRITALVRVQFEAYQTRHNRRFDPSEKPANFLEVTRSYGGHHDIELFWAAPTSTSSCSGQRFTLVCRFFGFVCVFCVALWLCCSLCLSHLAAIDRPTVLLMW